MSDALEHLAAAFDQLPDDPRHLEPDDVDLVLAVLRGQSEFRNGLTHRWREIRDEVRAVTVVDPPLALAARVQDLIQRDLKLLIAERVLEPFLERALELEGTGAYVGTTSAEGGGEHW